MVQVEKGIVVKEQQMLPKQLSRTFGTAPWLACNVVVVALVLPVTAAAATAANLDPISAADLGIEGA